MIHQREVMLLVLGSILLTSETVAQSISLTTQEIRTIAGRVFENECTSKDDCLLEWNPGENFMSLGIGHFIWYPASQSGPFEESFPKFLEFLKSKGEVLPGWLTTNPTPDCPWISRDDFLNNRNSPQAAELKQLLQKSKPQQGDFLIKQINDALPLMLRYTVPEMRTHIREQFYRLAATPKGVFALVDYTNFKGLGISPSEQYQGKGWGLLQVLSGMDGRKDAQPALNEFVLVAEHLLTERVAHAPPDRHEERWLPGWTRRVRSYLDMKTLK